MDWNYVTTVILPLVVTFGLRVAAALVGFWLALRLANLVQQRITAGLKSREFDVTLSLFFGTLARWLIMIMSVLAILGVFGVETASFAALIGAAGFAAGLAFQGTLANFAAGVMLLLFRPFKVSDRIVVGSHKGAVAEIGIFATSIDTTDKRRKVLPNSMVNAGVIENHSHHPVRRVDVVCYFGGENPPQAIREMLSTVGAKHTKPGLRAFEIVVKRLHPYGSEWELRIFAPCFDHNDVLYEAHEDVLRGMAAAGITPPGPMAAGGPNDPTANDT